MRQVDSRLINCALAEHLFGFRVADLSSRADRYMPAIVGDAERNYKVDEYECVPDYLTGDGMLMVLRALRDRGWAVEMTGDRERAGWGVDLYDERPEERGPERFLGAGIDLELPMAVTRAALAALGVEVPA